MRHVALAMAITIGLSGCSDDAGSTKDGAVAEDSAVTKDSSVAKDSAGNVDSKATPDTTPAGVFTIPLTDVTTTAKYYKHKTSTNVEVHFFAVQGSTGSAHVAFDACDVCYKAKKGYQQVGTVMMCRNCGKKYPIDSIGTKNIGGGCWPGYLPITVTKTHVEILHTDIATGAKYF